MKQVARNRPWWLVTFLAAAMLLSERPGNGQSGAPATEGRLRAYFVDVEGGQATLFVTPDGHSLLIDAGWPGNNGRDATRIAAAAQLAGIDRLDDVLLTHYHDDHVGGVPQLVARLPVGTFIDHGPNRELDHGVTEHGYAEYLRVLASSGAKHLVPHPGQKLALGQLSLRVLSADGQVLSKPLESAGEGAGKANSACARSEVRPADQTENARSLGVELTFGRLKLLDLGDLTWDKERQLMCPDNLLGQVDVYIVSHHGWYQSSSPALVDALHARVAIMDNGETKGGSIATMETLSRSLNPDAVWQLHYSAEGGTAHNAAAPRIANLQDSDPGNYLELLGGQDGSFAVFNSRTGATQAYPADSQHASGR